MRGEQRHRCGVRVRQRLVVVVTVGGLQTLELDGWL
jgi:hypothetical protein